MTPIQTHIHDSTNLQNSIGSTHHACINEVTNIPKKILFVCTGNMDRSPTAENLLKEKEDFEAMSAGTWMHAHRRISESTVMGFGKKLRYLMKHVNLEDPEQVKQFISERDCSNGHKGNVVNAYDHYVKYHGLTWEKPCYDRVDKIQRIPRTQDINKIISHVRMKYAVCYSVIRDTGIRPIEASRLKVKDIDRENGWIYPQSAKHGSGRILKLKPSTVAMVNSYISKYGLSENDFLWNNLKQIRDKWVRIRNAVSKKLGEPQLRNIKLYDLRHHFATRLYIKTKDIVYVQRQLGHKNITNTLRYIGVIDFDKEEYIVKVASSVEEVTPLVEQGFEYVTEMEGKKIFRKPK